MAANKGGGKGAGRAAGIGRAISGLMSQGGGKGQKEGAAKSAGPAKAGEANVGHKSRAQLTKTKRLAKKRRIRGGGKARRK